MENTLKFYFKKETKILKNSYKNFSYQNLSKEDSNFLEEKISNLPYREKTLLYMKYIFEEPENNIKEVLNIENPVEDIIFLETLLTSQLGYYDKKLDFEIFKTSIENIYCKELESDEEIQELSHIYSDNFINKMRSIGLEKPKRKSYKLIQKVALFFLIVTMTLTVFLATNSEAREFILDYIIKEFNEETIHVTNDTVMNIEKLKANVAIEYIPEHYKIYRTHEELELSHPFYVYYSPQDRNYIRINIEDSKTTDILPSRSELIKEEKFLFKDNYAYLFHFNEGTMILYFYDNQFKVTLSSNEKSISKTELLKIAENIIINQE